MDSFEQHIYRRYQKLICESLNVSLDSLLDSPDPRQVTLSDILDEYDAFCFDGYGTLYNRGSFVYPSALDWFSCLREHKKHVRLVTNAASNVDAQLALEALNRGFGFSEQETISSGSLLPDLVSRLRETRGMKLKDVFYIGRETGKNVLARSGMDASDDPLEPVVAISSSTATPDMYRRAVEILSQKGGLLLVLNPDAWAPNIDGSRDPVSGALCEHLRLDTGAETLYLGKPFPEIWKRVRDSLPENCRTLMIGDTLGTDIFGGRIAGFDSALVVGRNVPECDLSDDESCLGLRPNYYLIPG